MPHPWDRYSTGSGSLAPFHPAARVWLPDDFFWDSADYFSPVGNDVGADVLNGYREWRRAHGSEGRHEYLKSLLIKWGIPADWDQPGPGETHLIEGDDFVRATGDRAIVAFAFAQIMVDGHVDRYSLDRAIRAVERQRAGAGADAGRFRARREVYEGWISSYDRTAAALLRLVESESR